MSKKGQLFLIGAIVLMMGIFIVVKVYNQATEQGGLEDFESLSKNYEVESKIVLNKALLEGKDHPEEQLDEFTGKFKSYGEIRDPNFGIMYAYTDKEGNTYVKNYLGDKVLRITIKKELENDVTITVLGDKTDTSGTISMSSLGFSMKGKSTAKDWGKNMIGTEISDEEKIKAIVFEIEGFDQPISFNVETGLKHLQVSGEFSQELGPQGNIHVEIFEE